MAENKESTQGGIEFDSWDASYVVESEGVGGFAFADPDGEAGTRNQYCVGYRHMDGLLTDPANWRYDHTNYWDFDGDDPDDPRKVEREEIDKLLLSKETSLDYLLTIYCRMLG